MRRAALVAVIAASVAAVVVAVVGVASLGSRRRGPEGLRILCAGDSITAASYPEHLGEILKRRGMVCLVTNAGRPGNTSGEYLAYVLSSRVIQRTDPDFVLLQLGTNDVRTDADRTELARFQDNMERIVGEIGSYRNGRGRAPRILLGLIPPVPRPQVNFDETSQRRVVEEINPALKQLASARGLALVDNYALFSGHPELLPEVHPTEEGYRALAENWARALLAGLKEK